MQRGGGCGWLRDGVEGGPGTASALLDQVVSGAGAPGQAASARAINAQAVVAGGHLVFADTMQCGLLTHSTVNGWLEVRIGDESDLFFVSNDLVSASAPASIGGVGRGSVRILDTSSFADVSINATEADVQIHAFRNHGKLNVTRSRNLRISSLENLGFALLERSRASISDLLASSGDLVIRHSEVALHAPVVSSPGSVHCDGSMVNGTAWSVQTGGQLAFRGCDVAVDGI